MTRSMMRGAALAAGLLFALTGCGAGQVTQTESQQAPVSGVNVQTADGTIQLRNVAFEYPGVEGYAAGASAPLQVRIINQGLNPVRLVSVTSEAGTVVVGGPAAVPSSAAPSPPSPPATSASSPAPGQSASPSGSASGSSGVGSASGAPSPSASPTPTGPPVNSTIDIEVPVRGLAVLDPNAQRYLQVTGLREELKPGESVLVTFRFDNGMTIETPVPVAIPLSAPPRSPMDLEEHE